MANCISLQDIYNIAKSVGLDEDGSRVAVAIAKTEGGLCGGVGDRDGGGSYGPFQFYWKGQLANYAKALGVDLRAAANYVLANPLNAAEWGLRNYLGAAIRKGQSLGLTGPELATYAQTYGQVSVDPWKAGQNYVALYGGDYEPDLGKPSEGGGGNIFDGIGSLGGQLGGSIADGLGGILSPGSRLAGFFMDLFTGNIKEQSSVLFLGGLGFVLVVIGLLGMALKSNVGQAVAGTATQRIPNPVIRVATQAATRSVR
jgi:hypothetical protein